MAAYMFQTDHKFTNEYSNFSQHSHPDLFPEWEGRWSAWITVIVPQRKKNFTRRKGCGCRIKSQVLRESVPRYPGLYELSVCDEFEIDGRVYLGQSKDLLRRILEYCRNGSHKHEKIDVAINCGYAIAMRYLNISSPNEAQRAEKKALSAYTYPWNIVYNNGLGDECYVIDFDDGEFDDGEYEYDDSEDHDAESDDNEGRDDELDTIEDDDAEWDDSEDHDGEWDDIEDNEAECDDSEELDAEWDDSGDHDAEWDDSDVHDVVEDESEDKGDECDKIECDGDECYESEVDNGECHESEYEYDDSEDRDDEWDDSE